MNHDRTAILTLILALAALLAAARAADMPEGFVYLRDVDPTIEQDIRYARSDNFTGKKVPGYGAAECVLVRQAAEALKQVQADLEPKGLTLRVYDCYRPTTAVAAFSAWANEPESAEAKAAYHPALSKSALFPDYIATRSGHSRGAAVDVTLVPLGGDAPSQNSTAPASCTAPQEGLAPDGSLAMGTTFDCFDVKANTETGGLTSEEMQNRATLLEAMHARGFKDYPFEWWHFTFEPEPYPDTYFDFPIVPRPSGEGG
ncbi:MAG: M15 family metallopeptidase [Methyloceanibacter sp.]|uniref:M15 family metallopeptidase n=1 Tax=Methyloceanibacter sp. TaxID=1965321 RepID=UPI003D6D1E92